MMMRILRSESKVKLANRLLRTNSPGLLSGSTLTGAMTTGPFLSPKVPLTGGRGGFSPTGEAEESQEGSVSLRQRFLKSDTVDSPSDKINCCAPPKYPQSCYYSLSIWSIIMLLVLELLPIIWGFWGK